MIVPMQSAVRRSTFARIGRSYPRPGAHLPDAEQPSFGRFRVAAALLASLLALGLIGWFLAH
jgi:hypothetical protein